MKVKFTTSISIALQTFSFCFLTLLADAALPVWCNQTSNCCPNFECVWACFSKIHFEHELTYSEYVHFNIPSSKGWNSKCPDLICSLPSKLNGKHEHKHLTCPVTQQRTLWVHATIFHLQHHAETPCTMPRVMLHDTESSPPTKNGWLYPDADRFLIFSVQSWVN